MTVAATGSASIETRFGAGVAAVARMVSAEPAVRWARLFGSRATGTNQTRADIDIAVSCPNDDAWHRLLERIEEAETLLKIDLLRWEDLGEELQSEIERTGVLIHER